MRDADEMPLGPHGSLPVDDNVTVPHIITRRITPCAANREQLRLGSLVPAMTSFFPVMKGARLFAACRIGAWGGLRTKLSHCVSAAGVGERRRDQGSGCGTKGARLGPVIRDPRVRLSHTQREAIYLLRRVQIAFPSFLPPLDHLDHHCRQLPSIHNPRSDVALHLSCPRLTFLDRFAPFTLSTPQTCPEFVS